METRSEAERLAFCRAIASEPDDDTRRLAFADWCEENGEPDRAKLIRLQFRLHERDRDGRVIDPLGAVMRAQCDMLIGTHRDWLRVRCDACGGTGDETSDGQGRCASCVNGDMGGLTWAREVAGGGLMPVASKVGWRRGFPDAVRCRLGDVCRRQFTGFGVAPDEWFWEPTPWALAVVRAHPVTQFRVDVPFTSHHGHNAWSSGTIPDFLFGLLNNNGRGHDDSTPEAAHTAMARALASWARAEAKRNPT